MSITSAVDVKPSRLTSVLFPDSGSPTLKTSQDRGRESNSSEHDPGATGDCNGTWKVLSTPPKRKWSVSYRELLLQRERGLNRNTCTRYLIRVSVGAFKLYFYPSAGGLKILKKKKNQVFQTSDWYVRNRFPRDADLPGRADMFLICMVYLMLLGGNNRSIICMLYVQ